MDQRSTHFLLESELEAALDPASLRQGGMLNLVDSVRGS
jgi:hypothetical protein